MVLQQGSQESGQPNVKGRGEEKKYSLPPKVWGAGLRNCHGSRGKGCTETGVSNIADNSTFHFLLPFKLKFVKPEQSGMFQKANTQAEAIINS